MAVRKIALIYCDGGSAACKWRYHNAGEGFTETDSAAELRELLKETEDWRSQGAVDICGDCWKRGHRFTDRQGQSHE